MNQLYKAIIEEHYKRPRCSGIIKQPTGSATVHNPLCGDEVTVTVVVDKGRLQDARFIGSGCVISQAVSSLLLDQLVGSESTFICSLTGTYVTHITNMKFGLTRMKCALIGLQALQKAIQGA